MHSKIFLSVLLFLSSNLFAQQMPECWYRSEAAFEKGEYGVALQWIDSCLVQKVNNYHFWLRKGEILYNQASYQNALESLNKAEKLKQNSSSLVLAKTYCILGDTASCFVWLKTYLGLSDKLSEGSIKQEPAFDNVSSTKQWKRIWDKEWYSPYEKLVADAKYCLDNSNWDEALDILNPRLKGNNLRPLLLTLRAEAFFGLGSYRNAIDDYTSAIKKSKNNHQYLAGRARVFSMLEKYSDAFEDLNKAIELSGGYPQYYRTRADVSYKNKQFNQAYDDITYYLSFYPSDSDASFLLALIAIENGNYVDALFSLGKLIKTNPNEAKYYYFRGITYNKTENYSVAEDDLNIALAKSYRLADSFYQRGIARYNLNEKENACDDWEQASKNGNFKAQELLYSKCNKAATLKNW